MPVKQPAPARQMYDDEWLVIDLGKCNRYFEECCGCGLNHRVDIDLQGRKLRLRFVPLDEPPREDEVCDAVVTRHLKKTKGRP